jgi:hypothetical protein
VNGARPHIALPILWLALAASSAWVAVEAAAAAVGRDTQLLPLDYRSMWADINAWNPSSEVVVLIFSIIAVLGLIILLRQLTRPTVRNASIYATPALVVETNGAGLGRYIDDRLNLTAWIGSPKSRIKMTGQNVDVLTRIAPRRPFAPEDERFVVDAVRDAIQRSGLEPGRIRVNIRSAPKQQVR